jgi:23S rRNA (uracil1939-C5)-methyltransferase
MEMILDITSLSRAGAGVGRDASGRVVFVPFTAPGDKVRVEIVSEEKRYADGRLLEIIAPSPDRVTPPCPVFGRCGGCEWQHLPYSLQWNTKKGGVRHALARVGIEAESIPLEELPADQVWEYRNRVQLRGFREEIGFYARKSKTIVPIDKCYIARPELNAFLPDVKEGGRGRHREYKAELEVFPTGAVTVAWNSGHSASGFRQVHDEQNEKLQAWVRKHLSGSPVLLDLYGGSGNLSLGIAERFGEVHTVDLTAPNERLPEHPANFTSHRSSVLPWLRGSAAKLSAAAKIDVILDPPREGLGSDLAPIVEILKSLPVHRILMVGCDADSWARAVARLVKYGWEPSSVGALDFFPQTHHVEALAVLERKPARGGPLDQAH